MHIFAIFVANGTAEEFDYYTSIAFPNFDVIPANTQNYTLKIEIVKDRILEDNELFRVTPQPESIPDGHTAIDYQVDVIIKDDDGNS